MPFFLTAILLLFAGGFHYCSPLELGGSDHFGPATHRMTQQFQCCHEGHEHRHCDGLCHQQSIPHLPLELLSRLVPPQSQIFPTTDLVFASRGTEPLFKPPRG